MATVLPARPNRHPTPAVDRADLLIGVIVGIPATVAVGAVLTPFRSVFTSTNVALILMIVVVAVAALGGRMAGIITALAAVASFDFFHTQPYLSLAIDSRDDIETAVLLLIAGILVGTIASAGRSARRQERTARSEIQRIHRVAEAASSGADAADVIAIAQNELSALLGLTECRFEALPLEDGRRLPRLGRNGSIELQPTMRFGRDRNGRGGFELPADGVEMAVLARGQHIGRFVLVPTPGVASTLEDRLVAVAIADQVAAVWTPGPTDQKETTR